MALPAINNPNPSPARITLQRPQNVSSFSRMGERQPPVARVVGDDRFAQRRQQVEEKRNLHRQAHEKATDSVNPIIPIIRSIDNNTKGIQFILLTMNKTLEKMSNDIVKALQDTQLAGGMGGMGGMIPMGGMRRWKKTRTTKNDKTKSNERCGLWIISRCRGLWII